LRFWALFSAYWAFLLVSASAGQGAKQKKAEKAEKAKKQKKANRAITTIHTYLACYIISGRRRRRAR
jgi:hypothetical protein